MSTSDTRGYRVIFGATTGVGFTHMEDAVDIRPYQPGSELGSTGHLSARSGGRLSTKGSSAKQSPRSAKQSPRSPEQSPRMSDRGEQAVAAPKRRFDGVSRHSTQTEIGEGDAMAGGGSDPDDGGGGFYDHLPRGSGDSKNSCESEADMVIVENDPPIIRSTTGGQTPRTPRVLEAPSSSEGEGPAEAALAQGEEDSADRQQLDENSPRKSEQESSQMIITSESSLAQDQGVEKEITPAISSSSRSNGLTTSRIRREATTSSSAPEHDALSELLGGNMDSKKAPTAASGSVHVKPKRITDEALPTLVASKTSPSKDTAPLLRPREQDSKE
ncbi:unnamed protein product [Amoebophrya sp. A25]|nr:unnamed protein product [Amoebophrya sp. A25]|eukprot:GSA25T00007836001.1